MHSSNEHIAVCLSTLRVSYPSHRTGEAEWAALVKVWSVSLRKYRPVVLSAAVHRAVRDIPRFLPSLGELLAICEDLQKGSLGLPVAPRSRRLTDGPRPAPRPVSPNSPLEKLASEWEKNPPRYGDTGPIKDIVAKLTGAS
jgi:hypothetical protein